MREEIKIKSYQITLNYFGGSMEHNISPIGIGNEGRQVFWNTQWNGYSFEPLLFLFTAIAMAIFAYGVYRRWKLWKAMGKDEIRMGSTSPENKIVDHERIFAG